MRMHSYLSCSLGAFLALSASGASADTLKVGKGLAFSGIEEALSNAKPGDVVEVQGAQTYTGTIHLREDYGGTKEQPVTVRGIPVDGKRPVLRGAGPGEWDNMVLLLNANHFIMERFEVVGDGGDHNYCIVHKADDVILRDFVIHDCLHQGGLVGNDFGSGSLTVEYSEFYHNGGGSKGGSAGDHQIYMATDEEMYPGSVFRFQFCYVHDGLGGNNVRSRAERNEIYYNWVEGAFYHELDLVGPIDKDSLPFREDSDIVGNVLIKKNSQWRIARVGGDGDGNTAGRYRFANNTMIMTDTSSTAVSLQQTVETLEMYNNVIYGTKAGFDVYDVNEQIGPDTLLFGANNWVLGGTKSIPKEWTGTMQGTDPGWVDVTKFDLRPVTTSPLIDQGATNTVSTGPMGFPKALLLPTYHPPQHVLLPVGMADGRNNRGTPDLGAFEANASAPGDPPQKPPQEIVANPDNGNGSPSNGDADGGNAGAGAGRDKSGCGCRVAARANEAQAIWLAMGAAAGALTRRRRQTK
jgi:hypothetical protein